MSIRCKFRVERVASFIYEVAPGKHQQEVIMSAVSGGSDENKSFSKFTPSGTLTFMITNPDVCGTIQPGQEFYLDLTPVEGK